MKYGVLFVFLFMGMGRSVWSQETPIQDELVNYYPKKFITHFEVLLGPSIIYPRGNELIQDKRVIKIGYSGGIGVRRKITGAFDLGINLLYENKGLKAEYEYLNTDFNPPIIEKSVQNIDLNYITTSVLLRYNLNTKIFFSLGPYVGYLLSERIKIITYQNGVKINQSGSRPDPYLNFKKLDFGITSAIGYCIKSNEKDFCNILFNYNLGLININQPIIDDVKNNTYSLILAIKIRHQNINN